MRLRSRQPVSLGCLLGLALVLLVLALGAWYMVPFAGEAERIAEARVLTDGMRTATSDLPGFLARFEPRTERLIEVVYDGDPAKLEGLLRNHRHLEAMYLTGASTNVLDLAPFGRLPKLGTLDCDLVLTTPLSELPRRLPRLTWLNLPLNDEQAAAFTTLPEGWRRQLRWLNSTSFRTTLSCQGLRDLAAAFPHHRYLNLSQANLADTPLDCLKDLPLDSLILNLTSADLSSVQDLDLVGCSLALNEYTSADIAPLATWRIEHLDIAENHHIDGGAVPTLLAIKDLTHLDLSYNRFTTNDLLRLAEHPTLESITWWGDEENRSEKYEAFAKDMEGRGIELIYD